MSVIGLDIGHSAVKVSVGGEQDIIFPTAATPAISLGMADGQESAKGDTVEVAGRSYFVGKTALTHSNGATLDGLSDGWIESAEHLALLKSGYQRGVEALGEADPHLVLGLPSRLHLAQKDTLISLACKTLGIPQEKVTVIPQAMGAFMHTILDSKGEPTSPDFASEKWGVIDIGFYTADYGLVDGGVWSGAGARSRPGANEMAEMLARKIKETHGHDLSLRKCDEVLRVRSVKLMGKVTPMGDLVDEVAQEYARSISDFAQRVFAGTLPTLDGILIAGGGASLVFPYLKKEWAHAVTTDQPRVMVAEGMRRYGKLIS